MPYTQQRINHTLTLQIRSRLNCSYTMKMELTEDFFFDCWFELPVYDDSYGIQLIKLINLQVSTWLDCAFTMCACVRLSVCVCVCVCVRVSVCVQ